MYIFMFSINSLNMISVYAFIHIFTLLYVYIYIYIYAQVFTFIGMNNDNIKQNYPV